MNLTADNGSALRNPDKVRVGVLGVRPGPHVRDHVSVEVGKGHHYGHGDQHRRPGKHRGQASYLLDKKLHTASRISNAEK